MIAISQIKELVRDHKRKITLSGVIMLFFSSFWAFCTNRDIQYVICTPPIQKDLTSDICGALKLGDKPTHEERIAWKRLAPGSCDALRTFVQDHPDSPYSSQAAQLLVALKTSAKSVWVPKTELLRIYVGSDAPASHNEDAARAAAVTRGAPAAERLCRDFPASGLHRFVSQHTNPETWHCAPLRHGVVCAFDGEVACGLEERTDAVFEWCPKAKAD